MGRNDPKHGARHKAAVVAAVEENGLTSAQVVTLAAAGQLKSAEGRLLPAFEIAESTVRNYVQFARRRERKASTNGGHDDEHGPPNLETVAKPARPGQPRQAEQPREKGLLATLLEQEQRREREGRTEREAGPLPD